MKIIKKIVKISILIAVIFIIINIIDLKRSNINSVDEISSIKKIKMYDDKSQVFYEINNLHESTYINISDISQNIITTFVEIEDKRFYSHSGFDIYRITKALISNITNDTSIGASTITQQYIKNIYLSNKKSIIRKIREVYYSVRLEQLYSKDEILEGYLNTIYFNHGIYGIHDASYYYFNKHPSTLSIAESATLAAIIKAPSTYSPITNFDKNKERKELILEILYENNKIREEEYNNALNEKINITKTKFENYNSGILFYKDLVLKEIKNLALERQNLNIYTSFNSELNNMVDEYIKQNPIYSNLSIVVLNNNGELILSRSKNYHKNKINIGVDSKRMIGSTIKPFLYYEALGSGMNSLSKFKSEPTTFFIHKESYKIKNYNDKYEYKPITMGYAIATSDNIYAMKTHLYLGSHKLINFLEEFDIEVKNNYPSLALGSIDTTLLNLCEIYNCFSRLGIYNNAYTINKMILNNKNYYIKRKTNTKKLDPNRAYIINELLTNTFDINLNSNVNVTGTSISNKLVTKASGKSGLTDYDSYMIGYSPLYTIGIWTGNDDNSLLTDQLSKEFPKKAFLYIFNHLMEKNKNIWYEKPNAVYSIFTDPTLFNTGYEKNVYFLN